MGMPARGLIVALMVVLAIAGGIVALAEGQQVTIVKKDGTEIQAELLDFGNRIYRVRLDDGRVAEISETDIAKVVFGVDGKPADAGTELVAQLSDHAWQKREDAFEGLLKCGDKAVPLLKDLLKDGLLPSPDGGAECEFPAGVCSLAVWRADRLLAELELAEGKKQAALAGTPEKQREIAALIEILGADDAVARDNAEQKLNEIGVPALVFLDWARDSVDPEVSMRAGRAASSIRDGLDGRFGFDRFTDGALDFSVWVRREDGSGRFLAYASIHNRSAKTMAFPKPSSIPVSVPTAPKMKNMLAVVDEECRECFVAKECFDLNEYLFMDLQPDEERVFAWCFTLDGLELVGGFGGINETRARLEAGAPFTVVFTYGWFAREGIQVHQASTPWEGMAAVKPIRMRKAK